MALELQQSTERDHKVPLGPHTSRKAEGNRNYEMTRQNNDKKAEIARPGKTDECHLKAGAGQFLLSLSPNSAIVLILWETRIHGSSWPPRFFSSHPQRQKNYYLQRLLR